MNSKFHNKLNIRNQIITSAQNYQKRMVGKTFLYIFDNRYIEVIYRISEFMHLTGVETSLTAKEFYKEACKGTLSDSQFGFTTRHPYNLSVKKMSQLNNLDKLTNSEILITEDITTKSTTFKFGLTELCFTLCLDCDTDINGLCKSSYYIAKSLRVEDCFNKCSDVNTVDLIFEKHTSERYYNKINYIENDIAISKIPDSIKHKINPLLICKLENN